MKPPDFDKTRKKYHRPVSRRLATAYLALIAFAALAVVFGDRQIVINTSPSVSPGLYVRTTAAPAVGQLIDFRIPAAAREYVRHRTGNDGQDWYIIKPIVAGPGDVVDTVGSNLLINGAIIGPMPPAIDAYGRALPRWSARRVLGSEEFFVYSGRIPNSFDSRCYGPVHRNEIAAVRRPILTW
jgi:conjugative transfer signal peptidase TraF